MERRDEAAEARQATEAASEAVESGREAAEEYLKGEIELSSGIILALRDVPPLALRQADLAVPVPVVPVVRIESRDRDEENPLDPDYVAEVAERDTRVYRAGVDIALVMGTSCERVPDGWCRPEDAGWIDQLEVGDLKVDVSNDAIRYLNWLHLYALRTPQDLSRTTYNALVRAGLLEAEIAQAIASFLSSARREADRVADDSERSLDGDPVSTADPGDGLGV
ncbi:hypothetical protein LCGC14_0443330 [marine sediment metagenome]|uniref:Uncharacterized protein n=1 Tax=marine sediment metagenome TaxID=412755 RepID=A0A0F9T2S8_9ZZZZ